MPCSALQTKLTVLQAGLDTLTKNRAALTSEEHECSALMSSMREAHDADGPCSCPEGEWIQGSKEAPVSASKQGDTKSC